MKLWDCFSSALRALRVNKLRSFLSMLGILIGVAAVISVLALGRAQEVAIQESFAALGSNLIYVLPEGGRIRVRAGQPAGVRASPATLTLEDAEAIARQAPSVVRVAPSAEIFKQVVAGRESFHSTVVGVVPEAEWVNNYVPAQGTFITGFDYLARSRVAVLGSEAAKSLFGEMDPIGQSLRIDRHQFQVIGVLESKGMGFGIEDLRVYVPLSTFHATLAIREGGSRRDKVDVISVQAESSDKLESAIEEITAVLRDRRGIREGEEDDFRVMSVEALARQLTSAIKIIQYIVAGIASISLLVGGIGIMNIMLVSVAERIREIGLRKAVGAKRRDILIQFLVEAATLCFCGGALGVALGWAIVSIVCSILAYVGFPIKGVFPPDAIVLSLGVAVFIGIVSGLYPAMRAAQLDPIESLRHE